MYPTPTVDSTVGKPSVTVLETHTEQDSAATYSDVVQEGAKHDLELFIHWGQTLLAPLSFNSFTEFKKSLALHYASEVMEGRVGQDINCGQAWYDRELRHAVIVCENAQSVEWFKKAILQIKVNSQCYRAWSFGERPELFRMRVFLPETYEYLGQNQIRAMILHFNPGAMDTLNLVGWISVPRGRVIRIEAGPTFFGYCKQREGKLDFLLGSIYNLAYHSMV